MEENKTEFTEEGFWEKLKNFAKAAGYELVLMALKLYYAAQKPEVPAPAKAVIFAALAYFISPIDAIPDVTPVVGYADDLGALTIAMGVVATHIDDGVVAKAKQKITQWFG